MPNVVSIAPVEGLPEIAAGTDLADAIGRHAGLADGDIVVVTSKIVSKAEGRAIDLVDVDPSPFAVDWERGGTRTRG